MINGPHRADSLVEKASGTVRLCNSIKDHIREILEEHSLPPLPAEKDVAPIEKCLDAVSEQSESIKAEIQSLTTLTKEIVDQFIIRPSKQCTQVDTFVAKLKDSTELAPSMYADCATDADGLIVARLVEIYEKYDIWHAYVANKTKPHEAPTLYRAKLENKLRKGRKGKIKSVFLFVILNLGKRSPDRSEEGGS